MSSPSRRIAVATAAVLALVGGVSAYYLTRPKPLETIPLDESDDIPEAALARPGNPGYVGPDACVECHGARVAEFRKTNHFLACRTPEMAAMAPGFDPGKGSHTVSHVPGLRYEMTREKDGFYATAIRKTEAGEKRSPSKIGLVYGVGGLDEVYFAWRGDKLYELPTGWLHPQNCWGNTSFDRYGTGDFSRDATVRCLECHNTWFDHVAGTPNQYKKETFQLGVTCERCHGPGREHVEFHKANREVRTAHAVKHPGHLDRERQLEVCTQCHGNAVKPHFSPLSYKPGEKLADFYRMHETKYREEDHVANQIKYLRQSKCFQKDESLTCATCHDPHKPTDHATVQRSCQKCHEPAACKEQPRLPQAVRADCTGCHMPPRVWMNVHFHTKDGDFVPPVPRYEHRIAVHPEARDDILRKHFQAQADPASKAEADKYVKRLTDFWMAEGETRTKAHRTIGAIGAFREAERVNPAPTVKARLKVAVERMTQSQSDFNDAMRHYQDGDMDRALEGLQRVLSIKPDDPRAHGQIGNVYSAKGQIAEAIEHWKAVEFHDANDPYGHIKLGALAWSAQRYSDVVAEYQKVVEIDPSFADAWFRLGHGHLKMSNFGEAEQSFHKTLLINPDHAGACQAMAETLRQRDRPREGLPYARRSVRLTESKSAESHLILAELFADVGRPTEARDAADRALKLFPEPRPSAIQSRADDVYARARPKRR